MGAGGARRPARVALSGARADDAGRRLRGRPARGPVRWRARRQQPAFRRRPGGDAASRPRGARARRPVRASSSTTPSTATRTSRTPSPSTACPRWPRLPGSRSRVSCTAFPAGSWGRSTALWRPGRPWMPRPACYTPALTATTERSRSGTTPERARDGASRAGTTDPKVAREPCGWRPIARREDAGTRPAAMSGGPRCRTSRWYHDPVRPLDERVVSYPGQGPARSGASDDAVGADGDPGQGLRAGRLRARDLRALAGRGRVRPRRSRLDWPTGRSRRS